jgi:hypothetical protein
MKEVCCSDPGSSLRGHSGGSAERIKRAGSIANRAPQVDLCYVDKQQCTGTCTCKTGRLTPYFSLHTLAPTACTHAPPPRCCFTPWMGPACCLWCVAACRGQGCSPLLTLDPPLMWQLLSPCRKGGGVCCGESGFMWDGFQLVRLLLLSERCCRCCGCLSEAATRNVMYG